MSCCHHAYDATDGSVRVRDVLIPPLRARPSRMFQWQGNDCCQDDSLVDITIDERPKRGLFDWLTRRGKECKITIKDIYEPECIIRRPPSRSSLGVVFDGCNSGMRISVCFNCQTRHDTHCFPLYHHGGCCMCEGGGRHLCSYQRRRTTSRRRSSRSRHHGLYNYDDYDSTSESESEEIIMHRSPRHRSTRHSGAIRGILRGARSEERLPRGGMLVYGDSSLGMDYRSSDYDMDGGDYVMRARGERYLKSTEHAWRQELIELMAEQREESAWERHRDEEMPSYEKADFQYRDAEERRGRIDHLTELLEDVKQAGLEREEVHGRVWDLDSEEEEEAEEEVELV